MTRRYLKKAALIAKSDAAGVRDTVQGMLDAIRAGGDAAAMEHAARLDRCDGNVIVTPDEIEAACAAVPGRLKDDIRFAHDSVRRFAEAQRGTLRDMEIEVVPGLVAGQKAIPAGAAGCYVPGGRYSHVASALMTVTTARVAGCGHVVAASPPRPGLGIPPAMIYAAHLAGTDAILAIGGVQAVASMAFGLFGLPKADVLAGPGNQFVAEAKRILFGRSE